MGAQEAQLRDNSQDGKRSMMTRKMSVGIPLYRKDERIRGIEWGWVKNEV